MCLNLFPWANFEKGHSAVKIHTQLDLRGNIPSFFLITEAKIHDVNLLDVLEFEAGAYYIMDRGYYGFARLYQIHKQEAFFVIRAKKSISATRLYSRKVDKSTGLRCDQIIKLNHFYSKNKIKEPMHINSGLVAVTIFTILPLAGLFITPNTWWGWIIKTFLALIILASLKNYFFHPIWTKASGFSLGIILNMLFFTAIWFLWPHWSSYLFVAVFLLELKIMKHALEKVYNHHSNKTKNKHEQK